MGVGALTWTQGISLTLFGGISVILAVLVWLGGRPGGGARWQIALRTALPFVLLGGLMLQAWWNQSGTRLMAEIDAFRIPAAAAPQGTSPELMFRVGDRSEAADLIVTPYRKAHLNRMFEAEEPREFVRVEAARSPVDPARMAVRLVLKDYPGNPAEDIPGIHVTRSADPCAPVAGLERWVDLAPGQTTRIFIFRDDGEGRCGPRQTRYQLRRSFDVAHEAATPRRDARVVISLREPLRASAGTCLYPRDILLPVTDESALPPGYLMPRNLEFSALGAGNHDRAVLSSEAIGPAADSIERCDEARQELIWPDKGADQRTSISMAFTFLTLPWLHMWLLAAVSGAVWLLGRQAQEDSLAERVLVPVALYLLAVRSLVSIASAIYDGSIDPNEFYADAAAAIIALPPLLIAMIRPAVQADRRQWLQWLVLMGVLFAVSLLWFRGNPYGRDQMFLLVVAAGLVALRAWRDAVNPFVWAFERVRPRQLLAAGAQPLGGRLARLVAPSRGAVSRVWQWTAPHPGRNLPRALTGLTLLGAAALVWLLGSAFLFGEVLLMLLPILVVLACVFLGGTILARQFIPAELLGESPLFNAAIVLLGTMGLVRLMIVPLGWKERIAQVLPISVGYLPLLIAGVALGVIGLLRFRRFVRTGAAVLGLALLFAGVAAPFMARDTGFVLVHLAPIALLAAVLVWRGDVARRARRWALGAVLFPLVAVLGGLAVQSAVAVMDVPEPDASLYEAMNAALEFDANGLRLLQIFSPGSVETIGTRNSFDQMEQTAMLHSLTATLGGSGWLAPVDLLSMRKEQAWDYVSAVHLMYPFGRLGAVAFLSVLFAAAFALVRPLLPGAKLSADLPARPLFLRLTGTMAVLTLAYSAAYMVLANLLMVPFTGRSIYLVSSLSTGDLLEGAVVMALAALAVTEVRS